MTFDRRLANITGLIVRSLCCPYTDKNLIKFLHEITVNSQGQLNPYSSIVRSLATPPTAHHYIT